MSDNEMSEDEIPEDETAAPSAPSATPNAPDLLGTTADPALTEDLALAPLKRADLPPEARLRRVRRLPRCHGPDAFPVDRTPYRGDPQVRHASPHFGGLQHHPGGAAGQSPTRFSDPPRVRIAVLLRVGDDQPHHHGPPGAPVA